MQQPWLQCLPTAVDANNAGEKRYRNNIRNGATAVGLTLVTRPATIKEAGKAVDTMTTSQRREPTHKAAIPKRIIFGINGTAPWERSATREGPESIEKQRITNITIVTMLI